MKEIWRPVVGYEDCYEVSNAGRVRRTFNRWGKRIDRLRRFGNRKGYHSITLCRHKLKRTFMVHSLVAAAFIGPKPPGLLPNHKDGVPTNNQARNLEYVTHSENAKHGYRVLGRKPVINPQIGEKNGRATISTSDVRTIRKLYASGKYSQQRIADRYGLTQASVSAIILRKSWASVS